MKSSQLISALLLSGLSFAGFAASSQFKTLPPDGTYVFESKTSPPVCIAIAAGVDRSFNMNIPSLPAVLLCTTSVGKGETTETGQFRCINQAAPDPAVPGKTSGYFGRFSAASITIESASQYLYGDGVGDPGAGVTVGTLNVELLQKATFKPDKSGLCVP